MSWLDLIPVSTDVYVFQAALLCEDCGRAVLDRLRGQGVEDDGSSDKLPQGPYGDGGGEADSPQFCDRGRSCVNALGAPATVRKIGCPLGNPLTSDGVLSLRESIRRDLVVSRPFDRLVGRLLAKVWQSYARPSECLSPYPRDTKIPSFIEVSLTRAGIEGAKLIALDTENVYLVARKNEDEVYLLRSAVDDEGNFESIDSVTIPASASYDPYKLVAEAVTDMAWD